MGAPSKASKDEGGGKSLAQVTLIPTESKKLIGRAIVRKMIGQALRDGIVQIKKGSTTIFVAEEILGRRPPTDRWVSGVVIPKGTCREKSPSLGPPPSDRSLIDISSMWWIFEKGRLRTESLSFKDLIEMMGPQDVHVFSANALDTSGNVGVLVHAPDAGSIGYMIPASRARGFRVICAIGLEKLIPLSVREAAKHAKLSKYCYTMGVSAGLYPCKNVSVVVTELEAIHALTGCTATPISAGGVAGGEGAVTLVLEGSKEQIDDALSQIKAVKGAQLPKVREQPCESCSLTVMDCGLKKDSQPA